MTRFFAAILAGLAVYHCGSAQDVEMEVDANMEDGTFDAQEYPLHHLVSIGDIEGVHAEIDNHSDLNVVNNHGWTPLMFAVEHGREEIFNLLLDSQADVNIQENDGWTALMFAGFHGDAGMVDRILEVGGDALAVNNFGYAAHTITHNREHFDLAERIATAGVVQALATDNLDQCIALIQEGADVHAQNDNGWTTLTLAASLNRVGEVGWLLHDKHANPDWLENDGWSPLMFAANNDFYEVAELLVNGGADVEQVSVSGASAVSLATEHGFTDILDLLTGSPSYRPRNSDGEVEGYSEVVLSEPQIETTTAVHTDSAAASAAAAASEEKPDAATAEKHDEKKKSKFFW